MFCCIGGECDGGKDASGSEGEVTGGDEGEETGDKGGGGVGFGVEGDRVLGC